MWITGSTLLILNQHGILQRKFGRRLVWNSEIVSNTNFYNSLKALEVFTNMIFQVRYLHNTGWLWCGEEDLLVFVDKLVEGKVPYLMLTEYKEQHNTIKKQEREKHGIQSTTTEES